MELELGLKITRTREDVSSSVDFRFSKDPFGPLVLSRETDWRFIIIIHLKGFKKEGIEIEINEEGNRITISGRKPVEETVLIRWMAWRKEVEFRVFRKVFRIPDFVDLDRIKARFDDDDATLTITMPKRIKGISGFKIEEDEEERVELGDVSETEHKEEEIDKGEVEEQSREKEESHEHSAKSETEIQKQEEYGEILQHKERESEVLGEEQQSFSGGVEEEEERDVSEVEHKEDEIDKGEVEEQSREREVSNEHSGKSETEIQKHKERDSQVLGEKQKGSSEILDEEDRYVSEAEHKEEEIDKGEVEKQSREREESDEHSGKSETEIQKHKESDSQVLGKKQKGSSGVLDEKEERDVSEAEHKEEEIDKGEVEEQSREREESDKQSGKSETEIQKQEEFGEIIQHKEREREVLREEQRSFSGGLEEEKGDVSEVEHKEEKFDKAEVERSREREESDEPSAKSETEIRKHKERDGQVLGEKQKGLSRVLDEEERGVSEAGYKEEEINKGEVEEQSREREVSDEHSAKSETEIQKQEEYGEIIQHKEGESEVLGEEQKGFSGGLDEEERDVSEAEHKGGEIDKGEVENESREREKSDEHSGKSETEIQKHKERESEVLGGKQKGSSGVLDEEEERDISEDVHKEEELDKGEVEEQSRERGASDEHSAKSETEIQKHKGRDSQVLGEKQKGFSGVLDEEDRKDDNLKMIQQIDEQDQILDCVQDKKEEKKGLQELTDSNKESEESNLRKFPDVEGRDPHDEQTRDEDQELVKEQEAETKSDDFGSRAFEETEEPEPDVSGRTSKSRGMEKDMTDDDGLSKVQGIEEPERQNEESKIQEIVEGETSDQEKKQFVKMEIRDRDAKEEVDEKMGEGSQVLGKDDIGETDTKVEEFKSDKLEADEVEETHELVEKKEDEGENVKARKQSEDRSLIKLQESEEQLSKGQDLHRRNEKIKQVVEEKTPETNTNIRSDILKPVQEIEVPEVDTLEETGDEEKDEEDKKAATGDAKVQVDARMDERFTLDIAEIETKAEEFEHDKQKADEVDKAQKLIEEKVEEEDNVKAGTQSEDISLTKLQEIEEQKIEGQKQHEKQDKIKGLVEQQAPEAESKNQPEEYKEKFMATREKINDAGARKVQEIIREQMLDEPARGEKESKTRELVKSITNDEEKKGKEFAETETKVQESSRPKTLREQEKVEQLAEEKTTFSKEGRVQEEEEIAKKKTEFCDDDDIPRKFRDIEQQDSVAMKGKEEKLLEEKVCDGGKGIIAVAETTAENDKLKKVQETDKQKSLEEDIYTKKFQKPIGGETSGHEEVEDVEKKKKKTTEAEKRIKDSAREAQEIGKRDLDASGKYIEGTPIEELEKNRGIHRNEYAGEEKNEADKPEKIPGTIEQDFFNLNSQLEQDSVEDGEKTHELVGEIIKDCDKEVGCEESKTKIVDDDVVRKVSDVNEQELYEPKREHVSKIKGLVEEKTGDHDNQEEKEIVESEIEAEYGSLRKVKGIEEQELHEPEIHKERDKNQIEEPILQEEVKEVPSFQEEEKKEERSGEEEENIVKPMKITEIDQQEYDEFKRSTIQEQEIEEKDKTRTMEENEIVERKKTKDAGLRKIRDDEDLELSKPYKRQKNDKIQELVEMGTSDYRERVKKQDENDILRIPETVRPDLGEFERHDEQSNIPQLVEEEEVGSISELGKKIEDDSSGKFHELEEEKSYENWTQEEQEKRKDLVKEEATDPKDKHTGEDNEERQQQEEKIITKAEPKTEEDNSIKVHEIDQQENDKLKRSMVQDKMQETEEKDKTRAMEENEIVERGTETKDVSLEKCPESERHGEEDGIQELVETKISDHREKEKKKDGDDILRSQETGELERHCKQRKSHETIEDEKGEGKMENISEQGGILKSDSSGKFQEFQKPKPYEDWRQEGNEETKKLVKEAADPKDKHTGGARGEEEERYEKVAQTEMKKTAEDEMDEKIGENKEPELDKEERYKKQDKLTRVLREGESDRGKEISQELKVQEKTDIISDYVEDVTGVKKDEQAEEAADEVAKSENGSSRELQTIKDDELEESEEHKEQTKISETYDPEVREADEERVADEETEEEIPKSRNVRESTKELEADVQENEGKTDTCRDDDREEMRVEKGKQEKTVETVSRERFETQSDDGIQRKIQDTKMEEFIEKRGEIEEVERKKMVTKDESLTKGQEFLEKKSNLPKRRPVEQEIIREPEEVETRDRVYKDEEKAEGERKINDDQSRKSKMLELDEPEEQKKIQKPMEEKPNATEIEKEEKKEPAEEEIRDKIDSRVKDQESYELLKNEEYDKIPECHREEEKTMEQRGIEEMMRTAEDVSSRKIQQIKAQESDGVEKHRKLSDKQQEEEEMYEGGRNKEKFRTKSVASSESRDAEEKGSDQTKMFAEKEKVQELMPEEGKKEEYHIREREQKEKTKSVLQVESKANDDSSEKNETKGHELTVFRGEKKNKNHQELVEMKRSDERKEEKEEEIDGKAAETIVEHDSSKKIPGHGEQKSDKMNEKLAEEKTSDDKEAKEGTRQVGRVLGEIEMKFGDVSETEEQEQDKLQSFMEKDTSDKAKDTKSQETNGRDDSSRNTQENEKQEYREQKRNEEQDKKLMILVEKKTQYCRNKEEDSEIKEAAEAEVPRKLQENEKRESTKRVERHENQDDIKQLVEEKLKKQDGEDQKSTEILEVDESIGPEGLRRKDNSREQILRDNREDEETERIEPKSKHIESGKIQQIKEEEKSEQVRLKEQERIKELVKDRSYYSKESENRETEFEEDGTPKKIQDKEESIKTGRDEKRDKIQEPVDRETSIDDEEDLEIEFEEEEEDWEAEIIQEMDSDEDNDEIRKINRIRFGFRLVGGSTLFMSFIVIVIHFIHSKKKIRYYKF